MAEIRAREIIDRIEEHFPKGLALEWDNPGLLCGSRDKTVKKVMIALDCTDKVVDEAVEKGCDLVLTHHPLIFGSIKAVNDESFIGRRLIKLIKNDISLYAMHTRQKSLFRYRQKALRSVIVLQIEFYHTTHQKVRVAV